MSDPIDALTSRLDGIRRTGKGRLVAKCPAHKDRRASLSVRELDDGRVLLHCFAGCEVSEVLASLNLDFEALFPPRANAQAGQKRERQPFSVADLLAALSRDLNVAWVVLADVASGRELTQADRKRAGIARLRCEAMIEELRHVR